MENGPLNGTHTLTPGNSPASRELMSLALAPATDSSTSAVTVTVRFWSRRLMAA